MNPRPYGNLNTVPRAGSVSKGWLITFGAILILLGAIVLFVPVATTMGLAYLMAGALVVSGVVEMIHSFRVRKESGSWVRFLFSALAIIAGAVILRSPFAGMVTITLMLAIYFLVGGVAKGILAASLQGIRGRGWLIFGSIVSIFLGLYTFFTLPVMSLVLPGLLLGVDLVAYGVSMLGLGFSRRAPIPAGEEIPPEEKRAA